MLSIKIRNLKGLKNDIFNQQSLRIFPVDEAVTRWCFIKKVSLIILKDSQKTLLPEFFIKVESLTLLRKAPVEAVF